MPELSTVTVIGWVTWAGKAALTSTQFEGAVVNVMAKVDGEETPFGQQARMLLDWAAGLTSVKPVGAEAPEPPFVPHPISAATRKGLPENVVEPLVVGEVQDAVHELEPVVLSVGVMALTS